ncbi:MAG: DUF3299 domain-containing protein [Pseudomonadota bacterium]
MHKGLIVIGALLGFAAQVWAETPQVGWHELVDESKQSFDDPFKDLSYNQMDDLVRVVRLRERLERSDIPDEDRDLYEERLAEAETPLIEAGIDIDWLISQRWIVADKRKTAATAGNPALDGQVVKLAGFAIAAPPDPDGASVVYLVPERGMCSHMPPPAPNQMVRVRLETGWTPQSLHEPVRLTGKLDIDWSEDSVFVVDGAIPMRTSFALHATQVETLPDTATASPDTDWDRAGRSAHARP